MLVAWVIVRGGDLGRTLTLAALAFVALAAAWGGGAEPVLRPLLDDAHAPDHHGAPDHHDAACADGCVAVGA